VRQKALTVIRADGELAAWILKAATTADTKQTHLCMRLAKVCGVHSCLVCYSHAELLIMTTRQSMPDTIQVNGFESV